MGNNLPFYEKATLCWSCRKCAGRCSWSQDFTPVKGWKAEKTKIKSHSGNYTRSYLVLECPEYEKGRIFQ